MQTFKRLNGCPESFGKQHNILLTTQSGESKDALIVKVDERKEKLLTLIQGYNP